MKAKAILGILALLSICTAAYAQDGTKGDIRLFQSFFEDAHITPDPYIDTEFDYSYYDFDRGNFDLYQLGVRGGMAIDPKTELHARLGLVHADPGMVHANRGRGSETSLSDLYLGGRHLFFDEETKISAGGFVTLPTGREETGEDNLDIGAYSALRHPLTSEVVLTGTIGMLYTEKYDKDHETILRLAGGAIYQHNEDLSFIGEGVVKSRYDYMLLSGGVDYKFDRKSSIRGAMGVGVDDDAPDFQMLLSFFFMF